MVARERVRGVSVFRGSNMTRLSVERSVGDRRKAIACARCDRRRFFECITRILFPCVQKPAEADPGPTPTSIFESFVLDYLDQSVAPTQLLLSLPRFSCVFLNDVFEEEVPLAPPTDAAATWSLPGEPWRDPVLGDGDPDAFPAGRFNLSCGGDTRQRWRNTSDRPRKLTSPRGDTPSWNSFLSDNNLGRSGGTHPLLRITVKGIRAAGTNAATVPPPGKWVSACLRPRSVRYTDLAGASSRRDIDRVHEGKQIIRRVDPSTDVSYHSAQPLIVALQRRLAQKQLDSPAKGAATHVARNSVFSEELLIHGEAAVKVE